MTRDFSHHFAQRGIQLKLGVDMLTSQELIAEARFDVARERLARMVADGGLTGVSRDAYEGTLTR